MISIRISWHTSFCHRAGSLLCSGPVRNSPIDSVHYYYIYKRMYNNYDGIRPSITMVV